MKENLLIRLISYLNKLALGCVVLIVGFAIALFVPKRQPAEAEITIEKPSTEKVVKQPALWVAPDSTKIELTPAGDLIRFGRELVAHTALYLGPQGSLMTTTNGMNCQNCHLKAGKKTYGNSYGAVASTYPKKRARSGKVESVEMRVNDCIERSLNGKKLDEKSREMLAFVAYIKWVGSEVDKDIQPIGTGLLDLPLMDRPADSIKGRAVFEHHCVRCHGPRGEGFREGDSREWKYPPLAREGSYNVGAGLFRLSRFAAYVKSNMPYGSSYDNPTLSNEEAWDVAAYINSLPRPGKDLSADWPDISTKPFDHPFGPYADNFSEQQHKLGPFAPIREQQKSKK